MKIGITGETIHLIELKSGHYVINLGGKEDDEKLNECFYGINHVDPAEKYSKIRKVHRILGHASQDKLIKLYKNRGNLDKKWKL